MTTLSKVGEKRNPSDNVQHWEIDRLIPYAKNSRTHSPEQVAQIAASIKEWGFTSPILVDETGSILAGHGRLAASRKLGLETVPVMVAEGWTDAQKRAYVIADNKLALNAGWDVDMLSTEITELMSDDFDIDLLGFGQDELDELFANDEEDQENNYTQKVDRPVYEPSGVKPDIKELFNDEKAFDIIEKVKKANLPQAEKDFLMLAAGRHVVLNFQLIADYYAHSERSMQELMEDNALVIVDFDDAISNGWVALSKKLDEVYDEDNGDAEE